MKKNLYFLFLFLFLYFSVDAQTYRLRFRVDQVWSSANNDNFSSDDIRLRFDVYNAAWKGEHCLATQMDATATNTVNWNYPPSGWTTTSTSFQYGFKGWENDGGDNCQYDSGDDYLCTDWNVFSTTNFTTYPSCQWNNLGWSNSTGGNSCSGTFDVNVSFYWEYIETGNPAVFGNNEWNYYGYSGRNWDLSGVTYKGYYSRNSLNVDTRTHYNTGSSPSAASGYQGSCVPNDNHTVAIKRRGFPCGRYRFDITYHDDEARVYVDGNEVWSHNGCCDTHNGIWTGELNSNSTVEIRYAEGGGGAGVAMNLVKLENVVASSTAGSCNMNACSGTIYDAGGAGDYGNSWDGNTVIYPSSASSHVFLNGNFNTESCCDRVYIYEGAGTSGTQLWQGAGTGNIPAITGSAAGQPLTIRFTSDGSVVRPGFEASIGCCSPQGIPTVFPTNTWNLYGYRGNNFEKYVGYYNKTGLDFNTATDWGSSGGPSDASGWSGCPTPFDNHSFSIKRRGFPCGVYEIRVPSWDDNVDLRVNGASVWSSGCCGGGNTTVRWTGYLTSTSTIELTLREFGGGSTASIDLTDVTSTLDGGVIAGITNGVFICTGSDPGAFTNTTSATGGTIAASNGSPSAPVYQWERATNASFTTGLTNVGTNSLVYNPGTLTTGNYYYRRKVTDACNAVAYSNVIRINVDPAPVGGSTASDQALCIKTNANDVTLSGNNVGVVRWEIDDNASFSSPTNIANTTTTLTGTQIDGEIGSSNNVTLYVRAIVDNAGCAEQVSSTSVVRYNQPDNVIAGDATGTCVADNAGAWTHIYDPSTFRLIASINDNGQNLGTITASVYYHGGSAFDVTTSQGGCGTQAVMNRSYVINSQNAINAGTPVGIRLYFTNAELADLIDRSLSTHNTAGSLNFSNNDPNGCADDDDVLNIDDLYVTQISGASNEDGIFMTGDGTAKLHTPANSGIGNNHFGANYVQLNVTSFSEFWIHGSESGVSLPVELVDFTVETVANKFIQLNWSTATEINNEGFVVERSQDGIHFVKIGFVNGNGNSNEMNYYAFQDNDVEVGTYYYRLKQTDFDGEFEYSAIRSATISGKENMEVSFFIPNPSNLDTKLNFVLPKPQDVSVEIIDGIGRTVYVKTEVLPAGSSNLVFDVNDFAVGVYTAKVFVGNQEFVRKLVVRK